MFKDLGRMNENVNEMNTKEGNRVRELKKIRKLKAKGLRVKLERMMCEVVNSRPLLT